ncbi:ATP-binding protein [Aquincola sp. MAHUQ-54]|uniref:histidine kinase n=1 Tax=Aquincola agrisoli TaxID=3119538 RepID=A0AAW9Q9S7_9BURK
MLSIYILVTMAIFAADMALQYRSHRQGIMAELSMLQRTFERSVGYALWHMDRRQLDAAVVGMLEMPSVSRVTVTGPEGEIVSEASSGEARKQRHLLPISTFSSSMPLVHASGSAPPVALGTLEIQSNSSVILHRLQGVLLFAALTAAIKTAVLVLLLRRHFDRILSRPLFEIARRAGQINPKDPEVRPLPVKPGEPDELDVISSAINGLLQEVAATVGAFDALNKNLESQVEQRTAALQQSNAALAQSIEQLHLAQQSLVESEKMAALGGLVAGIAHEINTPVGLGLTGASHFAYMVQQLETRFRAGELEEAQFERFLVDSRELARSICVSLEKAAALVRSFKLVAVDQGSDELRRFGVRQYIDDVVLTHHPALRNGKVAVHVDCDRQLEVTSYPGAWSQLLSNFINNSVTHAFDAGTREPAIRIAVQEDGQDIVLTYADNGKGMPESVARRVYEPFFTTNRQNGGSGLGMHIAYNLVRQQLLGSIALQTAPGEGCAFTLRLPKQLPTT